MTTTDLESVRAVAVRYYAHGSTSDRAADLGASLARSAANPYIKDRSDCPCLGLWRLHQEAGKWLLEREPPPASIMYYFGLFLQRQGTNWVVTGDSLREEWTDIPP